LVVLEALRQEQSAVPAEDSLRLFDLDHKFHQAIAKAAGNKYLAQTLDRLFGMSRRLWYLALPHLGYLPTAVEKHLDLVESIKAGDADRAVQIMYDHVKEFYAQVRETLITME
jgi:DNA-binding GntR family transcriptional regulator